MHLNGGLAPDGTRVLSEESVAGDGRRSTRTCRTSTPSATRGGSAGSGSAGTAAGSSATTATRSARPRSCACFPRRGSPSTLLTNGGNTRDLYEELYREIFAELADVAMPQPLAPPAEPPVGRPAAARRPVRAGQRDHRGAACATATRYCGTTVTGPLAALLPEPTQEFVDGAGGLQRGPVRRSGSRTRRPGSPVTFYSLPTGEKYLHFGVRATPKVG